MTNWNKTVISCFILSGFFLFLTGCAPKVNDKNSPKVTDVQISSENDGTEEGQFVNVKLEFDRNIAVADEVDDSLRITIAGNRVAKDDLTFLESNDREVTIKIRTQSVTAGNLEISRAPDSDVISQITDGDGKYAVRDFTTEAQVPSGVTMGVSYAEDGSATVEVLTKWNIRSIAWVRFTDDGAVPEIKNANDGEVREDAIAVHGHDFLYEDTESTAKLFAETLTAYFGDRYSFVPEGSKITVTRLDSASTAPLGLSIVGYVKLNGTTLTDET